MIIKPSLGQILSVNYRQHPRYLGCVGHWMMTEGGGTTLYDLSGNGNYGSIASPAWTTGKFGHTLTNASVTITDKAILRPGSGSWSVLAWFFFSTSTTDRVIVSKVGAASNYPGYHLALAEVTGTNIRFNIQQTSSILRDVAAGTSYGDNQYHLLVGVADKLADEVFIYFDGQFISASTNKVGVWPNVTNTNNLGIGLTPLFGGSFGSDGSIEEVRIYNRALTPGEVLSLYQDPFLEFEEDDKDLFSIFEAQAFDFNAESGSYAISGAAAGVLSDRLINASAGSYAVTGADAQLKRSFILVAEAGSYIITGAEATLLADRLINAEAGQYIISGAVAALLADRLINAEPGEYVITGEAATLLADRLLNLEPGSYQIIGANADLIFTSVGAYELNAEPGVYEITGAAASILAARLINAEPGTYEITGAAANLIFTEGGINPNDEVQVVIDNKGGIECYVVTAGGTPVKVVTTSVKQVHVNLATTGAALTVIKQ